MNNRLKSFCFKLLSIGIAIALGTVYLPLGAAAESLNNGYFSYQLIGNTAVKITGYYGNEVAEIPSEIDGKPVTVIGSCAFSHSNVQMVMIPETVTTVEKWAFYQINSVVSYRVSAENAAYKSVDGVLYTKDGSTLVQYPSGRIDDFYTVVPGTVKIGDWAFSGSDSMTCLSLPQSLQTIGNYAFAGCRQMSNIFVPSSVTVCGEDAFLGCNELRLFSPEGSAFYQYATAQGFTILPYRQVKSFSVVFNPTFIYEGSNCYEQIEWVDGQECLYTRYNIPDYSMTVVYEDNSTFTYTNAFELHQLLGRWPGYQDDQSYTNQWGVGTHSATLMFMGVSQNVSFEIRKNPIADMTYISSCTSITEGSNCDPLTEATENGEVTYCRYHTGGGTFDITMQDGAVRTGLTESQLYTEFGIYPSYQDDQSAANQWGIGAHDITVEFLGHSAVYTLNITESPIASFTVTPKMDMIENTNGYEGQNGWIYDPSHSVTLHMKDGTDKIYENPYELFQEYNTSMKPIDDNQIETPWGIGEHEVTYFFMGKTASATYNIVTNPVSAISVVSLPVGELLPGESPDVRDVVLKIDYKDQTSKTVTPSSDRDFFGIDGYSLFYETTAIDNTEYVVFTYLGVTAKCAITRSPLNVTSASFLNEPTDTDASNAVIRLNLSDGSTRNLAVQNFDSRAGDDTAAYGFLYTDRGIFDCSITLTPSRTDFTAMTLSICGYTLTVSNIQTVKTESVARSLISHTLLLNRYIFQNARPDFDGALTAENLDILIHAVCSDGTRESMNAQEINVLMNERLALSTTLDLTASPCYSAAQDKYTFRQGDFGGAGNCVYSVTSNPDQSTHFSYRYLYYGTGTYLINADFNTSGKLSAITYQDITGDVNGDNEINIRDLIRMKKLLAGVTKDFDERCSDLDTNDAINGADLALLYRKLL